MACFLIDAIGNSFFKGKVFEMNVFFYLPITSEIDARIQGAVEMAIITAGLIASKKSQFIIICLFWFLIDSVFELGQKFSTMFIKFIPDWFASLPFLENTGDYFVRGTFSFSDIAAITIGTIVAYFVLIKTSERRTL